MNGFIGFYHSVKTACLGKIWFSRYRAKRAKVGEAVGELGSKISVLQQILNLVHQISIKLSGNDPAFGPNLSVVSKHAVLI